MRTMRMRQLGADANLTEIRSSVDNFILGVSTDSAERISGFHSNHILVIIDEASGVDAKIWEAVESLLASGDARLLAIGNPLSTGNAFHQAFTRNVQGWTTFSIGWRDTPNFSDVGSIEQLLAMGEAELQRNPWPMLLSREWVKGAYYRWWNGTAASSPLWQARCEGQFPLSSTNSLFNLEWLEAARRPAVDSGGDVVCGCDPSGPGPRQNRNNCRLWRRHYR
jgi:phage terminase large subunit